MVVLQVDATTIEKMQHFYKDHLKDNYPAHSIFAASTNGVTITVYKSGKALFQGANADDEASIWQAISTTSPQQKSSKNSDLPKDFDKWSVIGSDEVGTGSYFGSLVVCSAFVKSEDIEVLKQLGVQDSKNLTDTKIMALAQTLKQRIEYEVLNVMPEKYNSVQPTMSQGQMKAELHNHALLRIRKKLDMSQVDGILIDQFELPKTYWAHLAHKRDVVKQNVYFATKGESEHIAVAAASIIARAEFLESLKLLSEQTNMTIPSGAGATVDQVAAKLIERDGVDALNRVAKLHFANTQKAIALAKK
ncbi:ribonuclease HIII [Carnobacteriaceae bacterium zg-C25]|nr:ribonuclease HIII [Carnobacteriaceae bacterium zg-C25]